MKASKALILKVIVFGIVSAMMTVALGVKLANTRLFVETYRLAAEFDDATGVLRGDAVKIAGVDVGRVESAEIKNGKAMVYFNVEEGVELPVDSVAAIRWRNVLGQRFLYLYPGNAPDALDDGDVIPVAQTEDVNDIGTFLNRLGPILQAINPEQANAFLTAMNTALEGNEKRIRNLIDDGADLAEALAGEDDEIRALLRSSDEVMAAFASQDEALGQIFDDLDRTGDVLVRRTDDINTFISDFADVQDQLNELVTDSGDDIDASLASLDSVSHTLRKNNRNLEETITTLPMGIAGYFQTSSWGEWFNVRIVALVFKDRQSEFIHVEREADNQRGDKGASPKVGDGAGRGYDKDEDGDDRAPRKKGGHGGNGGGRSGTQQGDTPSEGLEGMLRFLLQGVTL